MAIGLFLSLPLHGHMNPALPLVGELVARVVRRERALVPVVRPRALAVNPDVLYLDEPFGALDSITRLQMRRELLRIWQAERKTILFVTHDIDESVYLAERVLVLSRSPARVIADLNVPLPHPRDQIETKERDDFVHLRAEVARLIRAASGRTE